VSRTPVREALSRLASEGLVELNPHRGARVASFSTYELAGIFAVRMALEPMAAARAAERAAPADVDALQRLADEMTAVGSPGPRQRLEELVGLNRVFHGRLLDLADRPALGAALSGVVHAPVVLRNFHAYDPDSLRRSLAHHEEMTAAVRTGDPEWAAAVMRSHLANARAVMVGPCRNTNDAYQRQEAQ
jgi:DNA-binding GntR family transcriptional regulator